MADPAPKQLPANAYTPLPPGTVYSPPVAASEKLPELTPRSVGWGVFLCVVFTVASAYSGLKLDPHPVETLFICVAGGCLGVLFLIPLRRYFVREMHGILPYPEATAITE